MEVQISDLSSKLTALETSLSKSASTFQQDLSTTVHTLRTDFKKDLDIHQTNSKSHLDEVLDSVHLKLNQHDARLSHIEEKHLEQTPDDSKKANENVVTNEGPGYQQQIEDLHAQFVDMKVVVEESALEIKEVGERCAGNTSKIEEIQSKINQHHLDVKGKLEHLNEEVATQRELNACL